MSSTNLRVISTNPSLFFHISNSHAFVSVANRTHVAMVCLTMHEIKNPILTLWHKFTRLSVHSNNQNVTKTKRNAVAGIYSLVITCDEVINDVTNYAEEDIAVKTRKPKHFLSEYVLFVNVVLNVDHVA